MIAFHFIIAFGGLEYVPSVFQHGMADAPARNDLVGAGPQLERVIAPIMRC